MDDTRPLAPPADALRLHPLSPLLALAPVLRQAVVPVIVVLVANWRIAGPLVAVGLALALVSTALRARFTRYTLDREELLVWSGVLNKTVRVASPARVQQVDLVRHLRHRATDLALVRIELAGTGVAGTRVELDALPVAEAERLRDALERGRRRVSAGSTGEAPDDASAVAAADIPPPPFSPLLRLSTKQLVVAGLTGAPLLLVPALIVSVAFEAADLLRLGAGTSIQPNRIPIVVLVVGLVVLWPIIAGGVMVFRCHGYELGRSGNDLIARRGLLDTRASALPLPRVQLVHRSATILRRWLRLASLEVRTASGGTATQYPVGVTVPIGPGQTIDDLIGLVLERPSLSLDVTAHPLVACRRAIRRRFVGLGVPTVAAALVSAAVNDAAPGVVLGVCAAAATVSLLIATRWGQSWYRRLGHAVHDGVLLARCGVLIEHLRAVPVDRIQSVTISQSPWQRRAGVCTARLLLAGTTDSVRVPDLAPDDAVALTSLAGGLAAVDTARWNDALRLSRA
jgi:putative membrane protein